MKKMSRFLSALLALCLAVSLLAAGAAATQGVIIGPRTITYTNPDGEKRVYVEYLGEDLSTLAVGSGLFLSGMVDYNAVYNDGTSNYIGYNTTQGTWYICLGSYSVEAFKMIVPDDGTIERFEAYGNYTGLLEANDLPVIDVQLGNIHTYKVGQNRYVDYTMEEVMPYFEREAASAN